MACYIAVMGAPVIFVQTIAIVFILAIFKLDFRRAIDAMDTE